MAIAIENKTQIPFIIGTNQHGELGLSKEEGENTVIDKEPRKIFIAQESLKEKPLQLASIGKSGFVLAIGDIIKD